MFEKCSEDSNNDQRCSDDGLRTEREECEGNRSFYSLAIHLDLRWLDQGRRLARFEVAPFALADHSQGATVREKDLIRYSLQSSISKLLRDDGRAS